MLLRSLFAAWRYGEHSADAGCVNLSTIRQEKAVSLWARTILVGRFRSCRKQDLLKHRTESDLKFVGDVSGSCTQQIFQALRPRRPVNRSKGFRIPKPLPSLDVQEDGRYRKRLVKVWQKQFSTIETADVCSAESFVAAARPLVQPSTLDGFSLSLIPTRAEIESALRSLSWRKAPGFDGLGAELWQGDTEVSSLRLFALFLKAVARGYLPLQFRGGFLVPLYKNRGSAADPSSYRGILLQNTAAKIFVKSWRARLVTHFKRAAVSMQCGCTKKRGVDAAHLVVRLHQHTTAITRTSSSILFVDIKAAYYSVVKELFYDTTAPDGYLAVAALFERLNLPATALADFMEAINDSDLLRDASVPEVLQKLVLSTLSNSWFVIPGASELCIPKTGTRPGDPLADLLFSFAMSQILFEVYVELDSANCLHLAMDMPCGTTWADDTCILLAGDAESLDSRTATAFSVVHMALLRHGLSPSYGPGKTAALVSYRGARSAQFHKRRFSDSSPTIPCLVEHGQSVQLAVTLTYKHLGSIVDGDSLLPEIKTRGGAALQAIKPLSKSCLSNWKIPHKRRQRILGSLGLSVACHNVGTWRRLNEQEYEAWSTALWKLYNCMYRNDPAADFHNRSIEQVSLHAGAYTPDALLHVCRLRLLSNLLQAPDDLLPYAIDENYKASGSSQERSWFGCIEVAVSWLIDTVGTFPMASELTKLTPRDLLQVHEDLAEGLRRALRSVHAAHLRQLQMIVDAVEADKWISRELVNAGWTCPPSTATSESRLQYKCPDCPASFRGEAHLATHRQRAHNQLVAARSFVVNSRCPACHKNFHTRPCAIKHVQYQSGKCLPWLLAFGSPISDDLARSLDATDAEKLGEERKSGIRSKDTRMPVDTSNAIVPPEVPPFAAAVPERVDLQGYSPVAYDQKVFLEYWSGYKDGPWTLCAEDWDCFATVLREEFTRCPLDSLESFKGAVCDLVDEISWRQDDYVEVVRAGECLYEVAKHFRVKQLPRAPPPETPFERLRRLERRFGSLPAWMGLRDVTKRDVGPRVGYSNAFMHLAALENRWREEMGQWSPPPCTVEKPFYKECYYLILYSGHRREGDIASQIWQLSTPEPRMVIFPVCIDLCIDQEKGNLLCPEQQRLWMHRMRQRQVLGVHASPPCETYTDARWIELEDGALKPRPLRTWNYPWGLPGLDMAEQSQLRTGSVLFYVAAMFITLAAVCGCCATLEHPRGSPPSSGRFRIWNSAFLERLLKLDRCRLVHFAQGPLGQFSWKPTTFLTLGLERLEHYIKVASVHKGPYTTLGGKSESGEWRTAKAKAFPADLCKAIALAVYDFAGCVAVHPEAPQCEVAQLPPAMWQLFDPYHDDVQGQQMGPDYWGST